MQCPKCQSAMEKVPTQDGVVDRCVACKGLWFDMLEHEDLKAYAKMLDVGSDEQGQVHNKIDRMAGILMPVSFVIWPRSRLVIF